MKADIGVVIEVFGKNEQVRKVFWTLFVAMAGLVLAQVIDPVTAQQVIGIITGRGDNLHLSFVRDAYNPEYGLIRKTSPLRALFPFFISKKPRKTAVF